jgi:hypothetical protein
MSTYDEIARPFRLVREAAEGREGSPVWDADGDGGYRRIGSMGFINLTDETYPLFSDYDPGVTGPGRYCVGIGVDGATMMVGRDSTRPCGDQQDVEAMVQAQYDKAIRNGEIEA